MKSKTIRVMIIALLLAATPTLVLNLVPSTTKVYATEDVTPPVLNDIWVSPSVVNAGESVTVYANFTDDLSGVERVEGFLQSPSTGQMVLFIGVHNSSSDLWEGEAQILEHAENGIWTIYYVYCKDSANNYKYYNYGDDYIANFTVTSSAPVGDIWSSDIWGDVKNSFMPDESVYVTVPATGQTVSLYVVADKSTWNDGDPLTDVSLDGVETLMLLSVQGTQTIQVWGSPLVSGDYDIVMDVDRDGVFDAELDCVDDLEIAGFFVVPEVPLGAIMGSLSMFVALAAFIGVKRFRHNSRS